MTICCEHEHGGCIPPQPRKEAVDADSEEALWQNAPVPFVLGFRVSGLGFWGFETVPCGLVVCALGPP